MPKIEWEAEKERMKERARVRENRLRENRERGRYREIERIAGDSGKKQKNEDVKYNDREGERKTERKGKERICEKKDAERERQRKYRERIWRSI